MFRPVGICVFLILLKLYTAQECTGPLPLLDGDTYNVSDSQIETNELVEDFNSTHNASQVRLSGSGWCSEELGFEVHDPHIQINLRRHFEITNISVSETDSGSITSFRILYTSNATSKFILVLDSNDGQIFRANFTADEIFNVSISPPIVADMIRIAPYEWPTNPPCLRLEIYGCLYEREVPTTSQETTQFRKVDFLILEILLPIALITIFTVLLISIIGVTMCLRFKRTADSKIRLLEAPSQPQPRVYRSKAGLDSTIKVVHNELYSSQDSVNDNSTTAMVHEVDRYEGIVLRTTQQREKSATYEVPPLENMQEEEPSNPRNQQDTMDSHGYEFVDLKKSPGTLDQKSSQGVLEVSVQNEATEGSGEEQALYMNLTPPPMDDGQFSFSVSDMPTPIAL